MKQMGDEVEEADCGVLESALQPEPEIELAELPTEIRDTFYDVNPIWKEIMRAMQGVVDDKIVRLLHINGFQTYQALKEFRDEDLAEIESFVTSGHLADRVKAEEMKLYIGSIAPDKFKFTIGDKRTISALVKFVKANHKDPEKVNTLGKSVNLYPMFKKSNRVEDCGGKSKKIRLENATVVSSDILSEKVAIKSLFKNYYKKSNYPTEYAESVKHIQLTIKTVEKEDGSAYLSASVACPVCKSKISAYREVKGTWNLSNVYRHVIKHKEKHEKPGGDSLFRQVSDNSPAEEEENLETTSNSIVISESSEGVTEDSSSAKSTSKKQTGIINYLNIDDGIDRNNGGHTKTIFINIDSCKDEKYSRLERRRRALGKQIPGQSRLTFFFPMLNQVEIALQSNKEIIAALTARCQELALSKSGDFNLSCLLTILMETAIQNSERKNHGHRYDVDVKLFAVYLFIVGGRMMYEFLEANLPNSLPSTRTVERELEKSSNPIVEGVFRFEELKEFLIKNDLPLKVYISEDGTRIQEKFVYGSFTNTIIGPVLPLMDNGVPIADSFPATSPAMIAMHFKNGKVAGTGYAIMVQPLKDGSPSFCLNLFGTDNKFTSEQVYRRWNFVYENLAKMNVEVIGFSADGDAKILSGMHSLLFNPKFGIFKEDWREWFFASGGQPFNVMQDFIHALNKFRTRLSPAYVLIIGKFIASPTHLRSLIQNESKELHGLTEHDLDKEDKMNFDATQKICSQRVTDLMKERIPGSEATVAYLTAMRYLMQGCMDTSLSILEKIYNVWYCVQFLRYWKRWLLNHRSYKTENFVTSNLYVSVEIIAHTLLKLVVKFRDLNLPEFLLIHLFCSQTCEAFFRLARALTTTESTVINFSMKEFLQRVRRIDMLQHCTCKLSDKLEFPREKRKKLLGLLTEEKLKSAYLPSDSEISEIVKIAKNDVILLLNELGIKTTHTASLAGIKSYLLTIRDFEEKVTDEPLTYQSDISEEDIPLDILAAFPSPEVPSLDPLSEVVDDSLPPHSIFVMVRSTTGNFVRLRKSTLCWLLSSNGFKLDCSRLARVKQSVSFSLSNFNLQSNFSLQEPVKKNLVYAGEWCIFKNPNQSAACKFLVLQILGFSYMTGSGSARHYTLPTAPVHPPEGKKARGLGCLCDRYKVSGGNELLSLQSSVQSYIDVKHYVASIPHPIRVDSKLTITQATIQFFKNLS